MRRSILWLVSTAVLLAAAPSAPAAQAQATLTVTVDSFRAGGVIPQRYAFCVPAATGHTAPGQNVSPAISWSRGPSGTASYAIVVVDTDVPAVLTDADKEGKVIPATMKRRPWYHWLLVDIPASVTSLPEGADSKDGTAKSAGPTPNGVRGLNDYGNGRAGYDGPCPPWNDAAVHHYHFRVYALNVARLPVPANFTAADVPRAGQSHVLAWGEVVGLYTQNSDVAKTLPK
ncbi:MAG TPA: YbhB/YbcL family Raf kinase inhibitor-like protein [bacterium]|nr:YbhB/YbcL family Raf kinase inhibitor-like protein [bacterium]